MKRRMTALALCAAVCLSLSAPALAAEEAPPEERRESRVTWEELEERVRAGSATAQMLGEQASGLEAIDFDQMADDLRDGINQLNAAQMKMTSAVSNYGEILGSGTAASLTVQANQLSGQYESLRETYDDLKDGVLQQDTADGIRQLNDGVNQLVAGSQTLYIAILSMEQALEDGDRGLATIDRSLTELRLRHKLGQVSEDTVTSLEQTRISTASQLKTLENTIATYKRQLQLLLGEEPTGNLTLAPLPEDVGTVPAASAEAEDGGEAEETERRFDWDALDYDADLATAKENSWTLRSAEKTLADAEEDWEDAKDDRYARKAKQYQYDQAQHSWNAAQASYTGAVQSFEATFQTLYDALGDYQQIWESKKSAVTYQEKQYANAQLKYQRGMISRNALLSAEDDLESAKSAEASAWRDLFSARNSYRNAVVYGLVGSSNS